eukprot:m.14422 g.14422  ORF g.14422 m.14422 type:complete len:511 (+) comp6413_c0_seq1:40-1572(+)
MDDPTFLFEGLPQQPEMLANFDVQKMVVQQGNPMLAPGLFPDTPESSCEDHHTARVPSSDTGDHDHSASHPHPSGGKHVCTPPGAGPPLNTSLSQSTNILTAAEIILSEEERRRKNRMAAEKCRRRKVEKEENLRERSGVLRQQLSALRNQFSQAVSRRERLRSLVAYHLSRGCHLGSASTRPLVDLNQERVVMQHHMTGGLLLDVTALSASHNSNNIGSPPGTAAGKASRTRARARSRTAPPVSTADSALTLAPPPPPPLPAPSAPSLMSPIQAVPWPEPTWPLPLTPMTPLSSLLQSRPLLQPPVPTQLIFDTHASNHDQAHPEQGQGQTQGQEQHGQGLVIASPTLFDGRFSLLVSQPTHALDPLATAHTDHHESHHHHHGQGQVQGQGGHHAEQVVTPGLSQDQFLHLFQQQQQQQHLYYQQSRQDHQHQHQQQQCLHEQEQHQSHDHQQQQEQQHREPTRFITLPSLISMIDTTVTPIHAPTLESPPAPAPHISQSLYPAHEHLK